MIQEVPGRLHAYRFTHELVRRALYDRLPAARRAALHLRVAEALEQSMPSPQGRALADLAYHFTAAGPLAREPAIAYSIRAAAAASSSLAFEEAASRLRSALDLGIRDRAERTGVLLRLGSALRHEGRWPEALSAYAQAAETARELGDTELFALAAIGFEEASWRPALAGETARELLEEAADDLADEQSEIRVAVLASLCRALAYVGEDEQASVVRAEAAELARETGAREGLALVQTRSYWARGSLSLVEVLDALGEARDLGEELGDIDVRADAMGWRVVTLAALGELEAARRELAVALEASAQAGQPFNLHICEQFGSALALSDGRLEEAERMAERSREWGELLRGRDASGAYGVQMFGLRREQARLAELAPVVRLLAGEPRSGPWLPGMAALLTELGMHEEAQARLEPLRREGLGRLRESLWVASLTYLADAYAVLPGDDLAIDVYEQLAPLRGTNAMVGHLVAFMGAVDRYLGVLAAAVGEWDTAVAHLEAALAQNRSMGATTWVAHTLHQYARVLYLRGEPGDRERAGELAVEAGRLARAHGLHALAARVERSGAQRSAVALPDDLSPREVEVLRLVAQGMSNREIGGALHISEHTAANHIAQHPPQDGKREPHRGNVVCPPTWPDPYRLIRSRHAPVRDRAQLRGSARAYGRRRPADPDGQRRRGRPLAVLVPERRPAQVVLPVRGAVAGQADGRCQASKRPRRLDHRGHQVHARRGTLTGVRGARRGWFGASGEYRTFGPLTATRMPPIISGRQAPTHARRDDTSARRGRARRVCRKAVAEGRCAVPFR